MVGWLRDCPYLKKQLNKVHTLKLKMENFMENSIRFIIKRKIRVWLKRNPYKSATVLLNF